MPSDYHFGYYFFAPAGRFDSCGMFTGPHIISSVFCIATVFVLLYCNRKKFHFIRSNSFIKKTAITLTVLEAIKISHSFIYNDLYLDAWFPLSYCGLFIFALWMCLSKKTLIKNAGNAFISYGCPIAGIAFLIFPTTSLMSYPIWHYFSLYSLFFHSLMLFMGLASIIQEKQLTAKAYTGYISFVYSFSFLAIILNSIFQCNLMNLREPYNIPIRFLQVSYTNSPHLYTAIVIFAYTIIPLIISLLTGKIKIHKS